MIARDQQATIRRLASDIADVFEGGTQPGAREVMQDFYR